MFSFCREARCRLSDWLKAIQDPQGEGRGHMCRYPSPDRAYAQDTWLFFAGSMKLHLAIGLNCILMASCSKTPLPWKPSIEDQKTAQRCIVDESILRKCGEGDIFIAQMIYQSCEYLKTLRVINMTAIIMPLGSLPFHQR